MLAMFKTLYLVIYCVVSASNNDHTCVGSKCGNETDCSEVYTGSLPSNVTCGPQRRRRQVTDTCILPPYPFHGTYKVKGVPNASPGLPFNSFKLTVGCRRGYGFVTDNGGGTTGVQTVFCAQGDWSQDMPKCVRFCQLNPDSSVQYTCHVPGAGFRDCEGYVPPGTRVQPVCNTPIYYSTEGLRYMSCLAGYWDHIAQCKAECGRVTPKAEQLVIGGDRAKRGELPWHAGIFVKTTKPYMQICGGSLVSNNVIISAAHCFWSDYKKRLPASDYAVAMGKVYRPWNSEGDFSAQKSDVKEIRIPQLFQGQGANLQEDVAVLILTTPIIYMTYVRPVCLNFDLNFDKWQLQHEKLGKVAGWGLTSANGKPSPILKTLEMPFINEDICINTLPESFREYITGDKFCAGYTNGTALCKGDSGGGLSFGDKEFGIDRYYLRGVVSAVPSDDDKLCNDYTYTTFTRISRHEEFIKEALAASMNKTCPLNVFQCDDGTCVDQGVDCNGVQDCADGSDETDELCTPIVETTTTSQNCPLPYPEHGTYDVKNLQNDTVMLTLSCENGYNILGNDHQAIRVSIYCVDGKWSRNIPKCVRFCKLNSRENIRYMCKNPGTKSLEECKEYLPPGTAVTPVCTKQGFFPQSSENMKCTAGDWDYIANCDTECGRVTIESGLTMSEGDGFKRAKHGEMPWLAVIFLKHMYITLPQCGANLISHKAVITSNQCIQKSFYSIDMYRLAVGKIYGTWDDDRDVDVQKSDLKEIIHSSKVKGPETFGVTILTLVTPFVYNSVVKPICLSFDDSKLMGQYGKFGAWVSNLVDKKMPYDKVLKIIEVQYLDLAVCQKLIEPPASEIILKQDTMCITYPTDKKHVNMHGFPGSGIAFPRNKTGTQQFYLESVIYSMIIPCTDKYGVTNNYNVTRVYFQGVIDTTPISCKETESKYLLSTKLFDDKELILKYV